MEANLPQDGDVLVSNPTATVEHELCIVPQPPHITCPNHNSAVAKGRELAEQLKVDAWLTEDHSHFLRIATFRQDAQSRIREGTWRTRNAISTLNHLIETCRNGERGFRNAAAHVQDPGLRSMCHTIARKRSQFAEELKQEIERLGSAPGEGGSVGGAVHRGWMDLKSAVTGRDDASILAEAERGEDVAVKVYEAARRAPLPASAGAIVERQYKHVKETHDRVKALEDEWKRRK